VITARTRQSADHDEPKAGDRFACRAAAHEAPADRTFEPTGCGRVLFSTYQTANGQHAGIFPQERVLMYLIGEIGVCTDNVIVE
jgi:hypothetical protein